MGRIIVVGDEHQCQPTGTMVDVVLRRCERLAVIKKRPIESIVVGDTVVSYSVVDRQWTRSRKILAVASREYVGNLVVVSSDNGLVSRYTPNHRCLVSFADLQDKWCVYLMRRGNQCCVGKAKMGYGIDVGGGLSSKMRAEGADAAWILSLHDDDRDARLGETIVASKFGIPQVVFKACSVGKFTQKNLDEIWHSVGDNSSNAANCLNCFGRDLLYPLISTDQENWTKSLKRPMFTQACNIMDGCKILPYSDKSHVRKQDWVPVLVSKQQYDGLVHSLSVDKDETYVADGIATHNSIYGFRAADIQAFQSFREMLKQRPNGCREFPLSVCRRCPRSHILLAQSLVPGIQWMTKENSGIEAPEGEIYQVSINVALDMMKEGDMGIGRTNKALVPVAYQLIRMRKKVVIRGRDIGTGLISLIKKMKSKSVEDLLSKIGVWFDKEVAKLCAKEGVVDVTLLQKGATKYQALEDKVSCIEALCDGIDTLDELISTIEKLFSDFDDSGKPKQAIVLGTVHRTKGLEAHNVTIIDPENFPHSLAKKPWERTQERNLAYVAVTRAKFSLAKDGSVVEPGRLVFIGSCSSIYKANWLVGFNKYPNDGKPFPHEMPVVPQSVEDQRHEAMMRAIEEENN